ncbi:hypothetical protein ACJIZ3_019768 [Penstemon smallii]|uniref:Uncharacterized protein n=1 Tax=Penstemon smallii TaxID=265156 RepID=A0ABD3T2Z2_9LAMI
MFKNIKTSKHFYKPLSKIQVQQIQFSSSLEKITITSISSSSSDIYSGVSIVGGVGGSGLPKIASNSHQYRSPLSRKYFGTNP